MMKKIFPLLLAGILCLGLTACAAGGAEDPAEPDPPLSGSVMTVEAAPVSQPVPEELPDPEPVWAVTEGVTFSLLQNAYPVGTTELTMVIDNQSEREIGWGTLEAYEKYVDGAWQPVEFVGGADAYFPDSLRITDPHSTETYPLRMLSEYRPLDEGLYRITGSEVYLDEDEVTAPWQVSFLVTADAKPEPDYALYISNDPIPAVDGCLVLDRLPVYFINTTGKDAEVLLIPHLEILNGNGEWAAVPFKDGVGFCGTPDPLPPAGKSWFYEISMLWGSLEDGQYRLSCAAGPTFHTEETAFGEFTLYTPENNAGLPLAPQD